MASVMTVDNFKIKFIGGPGGYFKKYKFIVKQVGLKHAVYAQNPTTNEIAYWIGDYEDNSEIIKKFSEMERDSDMVLFSIGILIHAENLIRSKNFVEAIKP